MVTFGALVVLLGSVSPASARSYHFTRVLIDATVLPDGGLQIVERRTYDFSGDFHGADYTIQWPADKIEDSRSARAAGTSTPTRTRS